LWLEEEEVVFLEEVEELEVIVLLFQAEQN
jgi:hypothetical protein